MPIIKKSNLTQSQVNAILNTCRNNSPTVKLTPRQKFDEIVKVHNKRQKVRTRKFHFKAIEDEDKIFLFNGVGEEIKTFSNNNKGKRECRIFALYEIFLKTPEEKRFGGYKIDFC